MYENWLLRIRYKSYESLLSRGVDINSLQNLLANSRLILMEAAIVEQLRRSKDIHLHKSLINAPLIYDRSGRAELINLYQSYINIALNAEFPFLMCTPTWRANKSRVDKSNFSHSINSDAARFMIDMRERQSDGKSRIKIGGLVGCKNDCYQPAEGLTMSEAEIFHSWQIEQLALAGVDFLIAQTLPNIEEAAGIAKAMEMTGLPYIISFVINRYGNVLDGTSLPGAVSHIDSKTRNKPTGYMVNCAYPAFIRSAQQPAELFLRLIGCQANASSLDHCELDESHEPLVDDVTEWGDAMLELNKLYGMKILGGCCGTGVEHLKYILNGYGGLSA